jgi:hypothetical protein
MFVFKSHIVFFFLKKIDNLSFISFIFLKYPRLVGFLLDP